MDDPGQQQRRSIPAIDFPGPRLVSANSTVASSSFSPFTTALILGGAGAAVASSSSTSTSSPSASQVSSRRTSAEHQDQQQMFSSAESSSITSISKTANLTAAASRSSFRLDSNESARSNLSQATTASNKSIGSSTGISSGVNAVNNRSTNALLKDDNAGKLLSTAAPFATQSMYELNSSLNSSSHSNSMPQVTKSSTQNQLVSPAPAVSRRSSQNSEHAHHLRPGSATPAHHSKPPAGVAASQNQQKQDVQQLQTEISIKDEMLKTQTIELVETHRRQAELEEQLAFFKIDAKFDSVANILLNPQPLAKQALSASNSLGPSDSANMFPEYPRASPVPPAPYIGKSPFKLVIQADPLAFRRDSSSLLDPTSPRSDFNAIESSAPDPYPLIIGLSKEFSSALRQLQGEINRISTECQQLRKSSEQSTRNRHYEDFQQKLESTGDRLDDDIEICRSRLGKLRADVPSQLTGSQSLNSIFDSLYGSLNSARSDLNAALQKPDVHSRHPSIKNLVAVEPSPLFLAALADNQALDNPSQACSTLPPATPQPTVVDKPPSGSNQPQTGADEGPHKFNRFGSNRFLQEAHRFQILPNRRTLSESDNEMLPSVPKNQSFSAATSTLVPPGSNHGASEVEDYEETPTEALTRQLLSRLTSSEQMATHFKTEMESLKARLDNITPGPQNRTQTVNTPVVKIDQPEIEHQEPLIKVVTLPSAPADMSSSFQPPTDLPVITSTPKRMSKSVDIGTEISSEKPSAAVAPPSATQTSIYITAPKLEKGSSATNSLANCDHKTCTVPFDAAAAAYKSHLSGLDRRLDTHENFVLNAFGTLLDRYIVQQPAKPEAPSVTATPQASSTPSQSAAAPVQVLKTRSVQVHISASDDELEMESERERRTSKHYSKYSRMKHSATDSNLKSSLKSFAKERSNSASPVEDKTEETSNYSKNFEQIFTAFKSEIQDIKSSFLQTVQQQQFQNAQQLSQLQQNLNAQAEAQQLALLAHQQHLQLQQQQREQQAAPPLPQPASQQIPQPPPPRQRDEESPQPTRSRHRHRSHSRSSRLETGFGVADYNALAGIVQAAEESLQTVSSKRQVLSDQVNQLELKKSSLEDELQRLNLECSQLNALKEQMSGNCGQYEAHRQYTTVELASKQQELAVVEELILDGRKVLSDLNAKTGELQTKYDVLQKTAEQHRQGLDAVVARGVVAKQELGLVEEKLAKSRNELSNVERSLTEKRAEFAQVSEATQKARIDCELLIKQREVFSEESSQVFAEHAQLRQAIVQLTAERENLVAQIESARDSLLVIDTRSLTKQQECEQQHRATEDFLENLAALAIRRDTLQTELDAVEKRLTDAQTTLNDQSEKKRSLRSEIDHLEAVKMGLNTEIDQIRKARQENHGNSSSSLPSQQYLTNIEMRSLERKLQEQERALVEERSKSAQLDLLARERQDEIGRLVGQLLVVHADYLNLHRQLRRMNAVLDLTGPSAVSTQDLMGQGTTSYHHLVPHSINLPAGFHFGAMGGYRESSPDLVVNSGMGNSSKLHHHHHNLVDRPSSSGSANSNPPSSGGSASQQVHAVSSSTKATSSSRGVATSGPTSGSQRSAESGYSSIA